jgi:hypothetical protein
MHGSAFPGSAASGRHHSLPQARVIGHAYQYGGTARH